MPSTNFSSCRTCFHTEFTQAQQSTLLFSLDPGNNRTSLSFCLLIPVFVVPVRYRKLCPSTSVSFQLFLYVFLQYPHKNTRVFSAERNLPQLFILLTVCHFAASHYKNILSLASKMSLSFITYYIC